MNRILSVLLCWMLFVIQGCNNKLQESPGPHLTKEFENVQIDVQSFGETGPCEPSIFVSPANKNYIVAGAILDRVYISENGGKTWNKQKLTSTMGVWGDPVICADRQGNFYYSHLSDPSGLNWAHESLLDRIVIQRSEDNGKTWNDGSYVGFHHPKDQDKQWMAIDPQSNHIYLTWTEFDKYGSRNTRDKSRILFAKSTDSGDTWSEALAINQFDGDCEDDDQTTEGAVPAIGVNGEIYVAWALSEKIYFDRSKDGGKTWLDQDITVADQPGGWTIDIPGLNRSNGMPVTATDLSSGPNRGTIYVNWADQRNGSDDTDIWIAKSTDGGDTWSLPIRVNDDPPGKHNFLTWLSVDPITGYIYIVFYDRRAYEDLQTDVYLAFSKDGGLSFENQKISTQPFTPQSSVFFGDYNNIHAYDNRIRPIWTRFEEGRLSVWTALIDL